MFESLLGNEPMKAYLQKAFSENRLSQTLLFSGPDGVGKSLFARALAAQLLRSEKSPDLHFLAPEGKSGLYAVDTLREMIEKEHAPPFEAPGKVFILDEADRMQPAAANALLKTLEEPMPDTNFILLTSRPQEILSTILSRCARISLQLLPEAAIETLLQGKGHPTRFAKWAHGSAGRAFELAARPELEEQRRILFDLLAKKFSYPQLFAQLEKLEELIEQGKEEDPTQVSRRIDSLFADLLMWHRDQHVRRCGGAPLFFPEEPSSDPIPLREVEKAIEKAALAIHRNIKLSTSLREFFINFS